MKSPTSSISIVVKSMVTVIVTMKESVLLLSNTEVHCISVSLPTSEGTIEFWILPVDRKDSFAFKLFTEDGEMVWCVDATNMAVVLRAVLVTMPGSATVMTNKVIVGVGGYDGDAGHGGGRWGRRAFAITVGKVGRGRSGGTCVRLLFYGCFQKNVYDAFFGGGALVR
jgi:hypothetical protein